MFRLVVFELHHLGDAVLALPFLRAAGSHFRVTIFCRPSVGGLLREILPDLEILEAPESWPSRLAAVRKLKLSARDVVACVWADARVHSLMRLSGAGQRVGFPMTRENYYAPDLPWRRRRLQLGKFLSRIVQTLTPGPLLTRCLTRKSSSQSHLDCWTQLAAALDFAPNFERPWITPRPLALSEEVQRFLDAHRHEPILLLHPGGRLPTKRWPKFQALLERLASAPPLAALIVAPPGEAAPHPCNEHQLLVSSPDWPTLFRMIQSATVVVCNDSLASHLAAALGRPVVTIFGSGNPDWFAPYQNEDQVVATNACRFRPCIDRCVMPSVVCLESVTVDRVENQVREILEESGLGRE